MKFWHFAYNRKYYLTHPWLWIRDFLRAMKYAWQRAVRGWDDSIIWSLDYHLSTMMPIWLRAVKDCKISTPILDDIHGVPYNPDDPDNSKYWDVAHNVWDTYLQLMIEGFESAKQLADNDLPIFVEAREMTTDTGNFYKDFKAYTDAVDELGGYERITAETDALFKSFEEGMKLFVKYYFSLWT